MKVGFGKVCITPPVGISLVGYFTDRRSKGVLDDLYANSFIIGDSENLFCIVACDLIWIEKELTEKVKKIISRDIKINPMNISIHATHTHTGPLPSKPKNSVFTKNFHVDDLYLKKLPFYIVESIKIAFKNMTDVKIGIGKNKVKKIAFNRRYLMKDGRVITNPFINREEIVKSIGKVDETLYVIAFKKREKFIGFILNFALHPDTIGGNLISSDWPGIIRKKIEDKFKCNALILIGPSGDINHINPENKITRSDKIKDIISERIFTSFKKVLKKMNFESYKEIKTFFKPLILDFYSFTKEDIIKAKSVIKNSNYKDTLKYMIAHSLLELEREKRRKKKLELFINGFIIDKKLCLLTLPGEIFSDIGEKIRKALSFKNTIIAQNSNFHIGYIPTREAFLQHKKNLEINPEFDNIKISEAMGINASYETLPLACMVNENSENIIINSIEKLII